MSSFETQRAMLRLIMPSVLKKYAEWPENPYWAHAMICRWHRDTDGLVAFDLKPYQEAK